MRVSMAMGVSQKCMVYNKIRSHRSKWMRTGGTPMTSETSICITELAPRCKQNSIMLQLGGPTLHGSSSHYPLWEWSARMLEATVRQSKMTRWVTLGDHHMAIKIRNLDSIPWPIIALLCDMMGYVCNCTSYLNELILLYIQSVCL